MWYNLGHANTFICTPAHGGRAGNAGGRSPVFVRLYGTPLPDSACQCRGPVDPHDCAGLALHRSDSAQRAACVPPAWSCGAAAAIVTTTHDCYSLRCWRLRVPPGAGASEPTDVRPADEPVDLGAGRRSKLCPRADAAPGQRRDHAGGPAPAGGVLETRQTWDHQSRSRLCPKKNCATG
jgi:hypothetical protein